MTTPTVLVVEDEEIVALDLEKRIRRFGYEVVGVASSAERAIAMVRELRPDIVLMDIRLQGEMDGIDAAIEIHRTNDVPIVFTTALDSAATRSRAMADDASGYLVKPVSEHELAVVLATAIRRARAAEQFRKSEAWLGSVLRGMSDAVIATVNGRIRYLNPAAEHLTGWPMKDAMGQRVARVLRTKHGLDACAAEQHRPIHETLLARDGVQHAIEVELTCPLPDCDGKDTAAWVFRDISERQRTEDALRESEERFRFLVDGVRDYELCMLDPQGRVISWNSGAERLLGYRVDEILGKSIAIIHPPGDDAVARALLTATSQGRSEEEGWRMRKDGSRFWANQVITSIRNPDGTLRGFAKVVRDVTERRRAEDRMRVSEERLRLATGAAQVGTIDFCPPTGELIWDDLSKELWGLPRDAAVSYDIWVAGMHREDRARAQAALKRALDPKSGGEIHDAYRTKAGHDGRDRWIAVQGKTQFTATGEPTRFVGTMRDISELRWAQEALRESEERLRAAVDVAELAMWDDDPVLHRLIADDRAKALWGLLPTDDFSYDLFFAGVHPDDRERVRETMQRAASGATRSGEYALEFRTVGIRDKVDRWLDAQGKVFFDDTGRAVRFIGVARDITERHHLDEVRERLTGIFAHDLRSPLSAIMMAAELLLRKDAPNHDTVCIINRSAERMAQMIQQLMDFTRVRFGGGMPLNRERVDLAALCRDAALEAESANPGRCVRCDVPKHAAGVWDRTSLNRVLSNLVGNALQHGTPDTPVEISAHQQGDAVVLTVRNQGVIPQETIPLLFDPFRRGVSGGLAAAKGGAGLGLGLYITREIVAAHGGTIAVRSTAEEGTVFSVRLPRGTRPRLRPARREHIGNL